MTGSWLNRAPEQPDSGPPPQQWTAAQRQPLAVGPLLDYGMRIYRRHFGTFLIVTILWSLPLMALLFAGELYLYVEVDADPFESALDELLSLAGLALAGLVTLGLVYVLSSMAGQIDAGQDPSWRIAWRIRPLRIFGMVLLSLLYSIIAGIVTLVCTCLTFLAMGGLFSLAAALPLSWLTDQGLLIILFGITALLVYSLTFFLLGMLWTALCYAYQPLIQEQGPLLPTIRAGLSALVGHARENLRLFAAAALTAGGFGLSIGASLMMVVTIPLALFDADFELTMFAFGGASLLSALIALPPLLIWMALAYRRRQSAQRHIAQLEQRIAQMLHNTPSIGLN